VTCPACGTPVPSGGGGGKKLIVAVVVAVGCFFLLAIGGIIAAIAIPNFVSAKGRAEQKRTMATMREISVALESFRADEGTYPGGEGADVVVARLAGHGFSGAAVDGWGHALRWRCWEPEGDGCASYELASPGKDGQFQPDDGDGSYSEGPFPATDFDADLVLSDGLFSRWPEGQGRAGTGG
jgi:type II secretory pathway pseudopilin PulG